MVSAVQASMLRGFFEYLLNPLFLVFVILLGLIIYLLWPGGACVGKRVGFILLLLWLGFYAVSTAWFPNWMVTRLENQYARVEQVNPNVHWVVVLGGGVAETLEVPAIEALSGPSLRRVLEGVRLYQKLPDAHLILSGAGLSKPEYTVAARFAEFTDWMHVPEADRVLESDSINTADEACLTKPLVGDAPFYLVTSALHMPRSMMLFEKQGLHPIAAPCNYLFLKDDKKGAWQSFLPTLGNIARFNAAKHEYLGQLWGKVRGKI
ncbi:MAG: ElyC/SanA/YdcF family protein [Legionellaceae bacterium]|nr:ElyC/SanA/YdcF family protein [Legionellaceae bacterium]